MVVFFDVGKEAIAAGMPSAHPDAAFHLNGNHQIRPGEVEAPFAGGVKAVLRNRLGQAEAAKDLGEGHAWGGASQKVYPFTGLPIGGLISRKVLRLVLVGHIGNRLTRPTAFQPVCASGGSLGGRPNLASLFAEGGGGAVLVHITIPILLRC